VLLGGFLFIAPGGSSSRVEGNLVARGVSTGALALAPDRVPMVAYIRGRTLSVSRLEPNSAWRLVGSTQVRRAAGYRLQLAVGRSGRASVLVQDSAGRWLGLAGVGAGPASWQLVDRRERLGPAGLALDQHGNAVIASAYSTGAMSSYLRLLRVAGPHATWERVTKLGFPDSVTAPAAMPVLLPGGKVDVVESYGGARSAGGIEWGLEADGWWGQSLAAAAFDATVGPVAVASGQGTLYSAWTAIGFGRQIVVLARRRGPTQDSSVVENATLAGLAVTPRGPELAVNRDGGRAEIVAGGRTVAAIRGQVLGLVESAGHGRNVLVLRGDVLSLLSA
jgi:hypothetical protein